MVNLKQDLSLSNRQVQFYLDSYKYIVKKQMIFFVRHFRI